MAKTFFNTPWGERSTPERIGLMVGGAVVLFIGYRTFKNVVGFVRSTGQQIQAGSELGALSTQNIKPNYTNTQYNIYADGLYSAMKNTWYSYGTDEDGIKVIMEKMLNNADVLKLNTAFGTRDGYSLSGWLKDELSATDLDYYVNEPLRRNGVTFQF